MFVLCAEPEPPRQLAAALAVAGPAPWSAQPGPLARVHQPPVPGVPAQPVLLADLAMVDGRALARLRAALPSLLLLLRLPSPAALPEAGADAMPHWVPGTAVGAAAPSPAETNLTDRELQALARAQRGHTNKQSARGASATTL